MLKNITFVIDLVDTDTEEALGSIVAYTSESAVDRLYSMVRKIETEDKKEILLDFEDEDEPNDEDNVQEGEKVEQEIIGEF